MSKPTIQERIDNIYAKYVNSGKKTNDKKDFFVKEVFELIERAATPERFCEECGERMVFPDKCINCGKEVDYKKTTASSHGDTISENKKAREVPIPKNIPTGLKALLEEGTDAPIKKTAPRQSIADKMQKLKSKLEGGGGGNELDNKILESQDPALSNREINWV